MMRREKEPTCEVGRQLEKERKNRDLTKEDWVIELHCTKPAYLAWLTGSEPSFDNIREIARVLDVTPGEVFDWIESEKGGYVSPNFRLAVQGQLAA